MPNDMNKRAVQIAVWVVVSATVLAGLYLYYLETQPHFLVARKAIPKGTIIDLSYIKRESGYWAGTLEFVDPITDAKHDYPPRVLTPIDNALELIGRTAAHKIKAGERFVTGDIK